MNKKPTVYDCSFIELPKNHFPEGNLTYVYNNILTEGSRVGIGAFGVVVPTMNFNDFLLRVGPMHKGYNQKLIKSGTIPDTDLGTNPNIQEYHYQRNPDD